MQGTRKINCNIAALKLLAMFGVICLHTFGSLNPVDSGVSYVLWYLVTFSIPVFFAASGYYTLNSKLTMRSALSKVLGIMVLILLWGGVFMLYKYALLIHHDHTLIPTKGIIAQPFILLVLSSVQMGRFGRLWFMWALAILYLLSPWLCRAFKDTKTALRLALVLSGVCLVSHGVDMVHTLTTGTSIYSYDVNPWFRQTFKIWVFAAYFVWGGVLGRSDVRDYIRKRISFKGALLIAVIMTVVSVTYQMALDNFMVYNSPEYQHDSPFVMLWVLSILICFTCYNTKESSTVFWKEISKCTLGIYFLHGMIAYLLKMFLISPTSVMSLIIQAILTFTVCYGITIAAMRIPVAKFFMAIPRIKLK